ncbi:MAG: 4-alpha-glucanotransferase, partial [Arcanobacterium sp.]|nr:4-alpha-glucanotransferase [Arcanobacterium sp.]
MSNSEPSAPYPQLPSRAQLVHLADVYGVAHEYWEINGTHHEASDQTLISVLKAMGIDASSEAAVNAALQAFEERDWRRVLPACSVFVNDADGALYVHVPDGWNVKVYVDFEEEQAPRLELSQIDDFTPPKEIDGALVGQAAFRVPAELPLGYHTAYAEVWNNAESFESAAEQCTDHASLIVTPRRVGVPSAAGEGEPPAAGEQGKQSRSWGMMIQLYSVRSRASWGIGDLQDLADLSRTFGSDGADFVLINPLHAGEPVGHMQPSPYLPVS